MGEVFGIASMMLWLVALYLLVVNATGASAIIRGFGETWFNGIRVLQGR